MWRVPALGIESEKQGVQDNGGFKPTFDDVGMDLMALRDGLHVNAALEEGDTCMGEGEGTFFIVSADGIEEGEGLCQSPLLAQALQICQSHCSTAALPPLPARTIAVVCHGRGVVRAEPSTVWPYRGLE